MSVLTEDPRLSSLEDLLDTLEPDEVEAFHSGLRDLVDGPHSREQAAALVRYLKQWILWTIVRADPEWRADVEKSRARAAKGDRSWYATSPAEREALRKKLLGI